MIWENQSRKSYEIHLWMISYHWCSLEVIRLTSTLTRHKSHERFTFINMRPAGLQPCLFGHVLMLCLTDAPFKTWPGCSLTHQQQSSTSQSCNVSSREKCVKPEPDVAPFTFRNSSRMRLCKTRNDHFERNEAYIWKKMKLILGPFRFFARSNSHYVIISYLKYLYVMTIYAHFTK